MTALTKVCLIVLLIIFALKSSCQRSDYNPTHLYPAGELQADLKFVKETLESTHPNLYLYTPKEKMDSFFDSLYKCIVKPLSEIEFYNLVTLINEKIKDGHTMFLPGEGALNYYNQKSRFFPFYVAILNNKLYVNMNCSADTMIKEGDEIVSINGIDAKDILQQLLARQIRDGYNQTYPVWILTTYFKEYFGFSFGHPDVFSILYKTNRADTAMATVNALSKDSIKFYCKSKYVKRAFVNKEKGGITLQLSKQPSLAILTIKSFDNDILSSVYRQNFDSTIKAMFTQIHNAQIQNLILDIRNNQGGDFEPGELLLSYLLRHPVVYLPGSKEEAVITPEKNNFKGSLYVLINGGSFSSTGIVSSYLHLAKRGVFIGEETAGNKTMISGNAMDTSLPHTGITAEISTEKYRIRTGYNNGHGVMPDYYTTYTIGDIITSKDLDKELALRMILKKKE